MPPAEHVQRLQHCLAALPSGFHYAVVVNDHQPGVSGLKFCNYSPRPRNEFG